MDKCNFAKHLIAATLITLACWFMGFKTGEIVVENRLEKMAKETGIVFIKSQPYKISQIKEIPFEIKK
jgi:hypothetical protein